MRRSLSRPFFEKVFDCFGARRAKKIILTNREIKSPMAR